MEGKIQRTFVRQEAYVKLRNWILDGTLSPGAQLRDKELAEQLGVSRTPIREALLRLEDEGLVKTKPNRSTLVCSLMTFLNTSGQINRNFIVHNSSMKVKDYSIKTFLSISR